MDGNLSRAPLECAWALMVFRCSSRRICPSSLLKWTGPPVFLPPQSRQNALKQTSGHIVEQTEKNERSTGGGKFRTGLSQRLDRPPCLRKRKIKKERERARKKDRKKKRERVCAHTKRSLGVTRCTGRKPPLATQAPKPVTGHSR